MRTGIPTIRRLLMAGIAAGAAIVAPAQADTLRSWQAGEWTIAVSSGPDHRTFEHCRASHGIDTGGTFSLAEVRNMNWVLVIETPDAFRVAANTALPVTFQFDQGPRHQAAMRATSPNVIQVGMPPHADIVEAIRTGSVLHYEAADGHRGNVRLGGTNRIASELTQCVGAQLANEKTAPAGAPPQQAAQPNTQAIAAQFELAATRIASNLLLQSRLPNGHLLGPGETPPMLQGKGAAWSSDAGVGSVMVLPNNAGKDVQQVALQTIIGGANGCAGDFAAGRSTSLVDDTLVTKAFTACSDSHGTHSLRFFILHRETSWYVVYAIVPPAGGTGAAARSASGATQASDTGRVEQAADASPLEDANFQVAAVKSALYQ